MRPSALLGFWGVSTSGLIRRESRSAPAVRVNCFFEGLSMTRFLFFAMVSILLSACAGPMQLSELASTKRMGVVSDLGTTFHLTTAGTTVFTNRYAKGETGDWQISKFANDTVVSYLSHGRSFGVAALDLSGLPSGQPGYLSSSPIWEAAKVQGFDRLVVVHAAEQTVFPKMQPGYGLYERMFFGLGRTCVYSSLAVHIYDVSTRKSLAWDLGDSYPCLRGSENTFAVKDGFSEYSEHEKVALRQQVELLLSRVLPATISRLLPR